MQRKKGKTYYYLIISFVSVLLLTCVGNLVSSFKAYNDAKELNTKSLELAMKSYDLYLQNLKYQDTFKEQYDNEINYDGIVEAYKDEQTNVNTNIIEERLYKLTKQSELTNTDFFLYFKDSDTYVSSSKEAYIAYYFETIDFEEIAKQRASNDLHFFTYDVDGNLRSVEFHEVSDDTLLIAIGGQPYVPVPDELSSLFESSELYFIDFQDISYAFSDKDTLKGKFSFNDFSQNDDMYVVSKTYNEVPYKCYVHFETSGSMAFVFFIEDSVELAFNDLMKMSVISLFILMIIGIVISIYITNQIYNPIAKLFSMLPDADTSKNEFQQIQNNMDYMEHELTNQNDLLIRFSFAQMLHGEETKVNGLFESLTWNYVVIALRLDSDVNVPFNIASSFTRFLDENNLMSTSIIEGDYVFFLVDGISSRNDLANLLVTYKDQNEGDEYSISIFVSGNKNSRNEMNGAYRELLESIAYEDVLGNYGVLVYYDDIKRYLRSSDDKRVAHLAVELYEAILFLNEEKMKDLILEIGTYEPNQYVMNYLKHLMIVAVYDAYKMHTMNNEDNGIALFTSKLEKLEYTTIEPYINRIQPILKEIKEKTMGTISDEQLFEDIKAYIEDNYTDHNLSAGIICDKFAINPTYLTRLFNKYMDCGYLDFLQTLRIDEVKKLLVDTDMSIHEIAEHVGYSNVLSLSRAFKRIMNMTPGVYRDAKRK